MNKKAEEFYKHICGKRVAVIGIGVSNFPLIKMLCQKGAKVTACDKKERDEMEEVMSRLEGLDIDFHLGKDYLKNLDHDIIFKTPGMRFDVPELIEAMKNGAVITSEMEVFLSICDCKIFAVTGSDGKTTTTTLIYEMLKAAGYTCHLGGNIGHPLLCDIDKIKKDDIAVVELSSFQLHTMKKSPDVAVITNISPNHLDVHKSMEEYIDAKRNIFLYQNENSRLVLNYDNGITRSFIGGERGELILFSYKEPLLKGVFLDGGDIIFSDGQRAQKIISRSDILIKGDHNVENYMAAIAAVQGYVESETIKKVANTFSGVAHRLEFVRSAHGVKYYNDSIGSSPSRTIAGLRAFDEKVILIAGGYDKNIPFDNLGEEIKKHVKYLILTGDTREKIHAAVKRSGGSLPIDVTDSWEEAIERSRDVAQSGDVVLFSPACASFDAFKNFEERGDFFKKKVMEF